MAGGAHKRDGADFRRSAIPPPLGFGLASDGPVTIAVTHQSCLTHRVGLMYLMACEQATASAGRHPLRIPAIGRASAALAPSE
jgi:hypothetical protein